MKKFFAKFKYVKGKDFLHLFLFALALPIALIYKLKRKNLWLFCDNGKEGSDNGFALFKYVCENHPEEDCVYAIYPWSIDYEKVCKVGKTVKYSSFWHWVLYLTARVNISSQKSGKPNYAVCNLLEVHGHLINNRVFLQHGVILTDIDFLYHENTRFSLFTTSVEREWRYVKDNYGYPDGVVQLLGLPRFDNLHDISVDSKQVLIMPTWREWLGTESLSRDVKKDIREFRKTEYFKRYNELVSSEELKKVCEKYGLKVKFYLHRDAQRFAGCFTSDNEHLTICKYPEYTVDELLKSSAFMVTDYSSVQIDFAYMKKPLAYFHFDYEDYSSYQYGKAFFEYENDGFGPVFGEVSALVDYIEKSAKESFRNTQPYLSRHSSFFTLYDKENCKRNYEAIKKKWS